jgi:membrane protein YqaA with SNARE-associated domain
MIGLGLPALFLAGFLASTLLPVGSEPVLIAYLASQTPLLVWPTVTLAVLAVGVGNTLGGLLTYAMGRGARYLWGRWREDVDTKRSSHRKAQQWLDRWGPWALLLSWVPIVGDPLCLVAGAMRLPFWVSLTAMALGKFARYLLLAWAVVAIQA